MEATARFDQRIPILFSLSEDVHGALFGENCSLFPIHLPSRTRKNLRYRVSINTQMATSRDSSQSFRATRVSFVFSIESYLKHQLPAMAPGYCRPGGQKEWKGGLVVGVVLSIVVALVALPSSSPLTLKCGLNFQNHHHHHPSCCWRQGGR